MNNALFTKLLVLALLVSCRMSLVAQDALAPCWRGLTGTTFQRWDFYATNNPAAPELSTNAFGTASAAMTIGSFGLGYRETRTFSTNVGWWELGNSGTMTVSVPGQAINATNSTKYVWVQVAQYIGGVYANYASVAVAGATNVGEQTVQVETSPSIGGVFVRRSLWRMQPATAPDTVTITAPTGSGIFAGVVVDTLNVEPAACPSDLVLNADPGLCGKTNVTWAGPPGVDGCLVLSAVDSPASGATFPAGTTPVTRTVVYAGDITNICSFDVTILDATAPVISGLAAIQNQPVIGVTNVLNCASTTVQGVVNISVAAADACSLIIPPQMVLTNDGVGEVASYVNESPSGVFNFTWSVTGATSNGTWVATVTATDGINPASTNFTLCIYTPEVALAMLPITISNSLPVVQFTATPGHAYTLQRSTDLSTNDWTSLTNIYLPLPPGGNGIGEYVDPDGVVSNAFYRVRFP
jgi:hypothetical protein